MNAGEALAQRINSELGASVASSSADAIHAAAIGAATPHVAVFPQNEAQVAAALALANRERWTVVPWGNASSRQGTSAPVRYDVALSMTGLGQILDHDSDNLTLTAQSGLVLAEANRQTRPKHQFLPLGFPHERRTLGGMVAANRTPPQRLLYGDLRDQILGLRVATADGTLVRYGRKVLKNVAGYDMNKLFLGSEGQLGVLVEVTLKLSALPDDTGWLIGSFGDPEHSFTCANLLLRSALQPSGIFILDSAATGVFRSGQGLPAVPINTTVVVGFEGRGVTVKRQLSDGAKIMTQCSASSTSTAQALSEHATEVLDRPRAAGFESPVTLRLGVAPTELFLLWNSISAELGSAGDMAKIADYGSGRIVLALGGSTAYAQTGAKINALRSRLAKQQGYLVVQSAPQELRTFVAAWGDLGGEQRLMRALKAKLDPNAILAPGRFLA